jgi:hypothetical protein
LKTKRFTKYDGKVAPLKRCFKIDLQRSKAALENPDKGIVYIRVKRKLHLQFGSKVSYNRKARLRK